jgi:hypothetical protein
MACGTRLNLVCGATAEQFFYRKDYSKHIGEFGGALVNG